MKKIRFKSFTVYYNYDENLTVEIADARVGSKSIIDLLSDKDLKEVEEYIYRNISERVEEKEKEDTISLLFPDL